MTRKQTRAFEQAFIPHVGWLRHDPGDEVIALLRQGYFEADEQAFFWLYLRPGDTFVDCGAHIGLYSVMADRVMQGKGHILAIEPSAATAAHLSANLAQNEVSSGRIVRAALWNESGELGFVNEAEGRAAYARVDFEGAGAETTVPAITLSHALSAARVSEAALVKIDVEGAEIEALDGAAEAIMAGTIPLLMVELAEHNLRRRGLGTVDLVAKLQSFGYSLFEFSPEERQIRPFSEEGPIWFKNIFACFDPGWVNARLRAAKNERKRIAADILGRATACNRFRELEELDRLRLVAGEAEGYKAWAERTEALLAAERESAAAMRAEDEALHGSVAAGSAEAQLLRSRIAAAEGLAADNRTWAERSDAVIASQRDTLADLEERLAASGARVEETTVLAEENRQWALRTEEMLGSERQRLKGLEDESGENRRRFEQAAQLLADETRALSEERARRAEVDQALAEQRRAQGELEARLAESRELAEANLQWATRTEEYLRQERERSSELSRLLEQEQKESAARGARADETAALLAERDREIAPLRVFARRLAWLFRLSRRLDRKQ